jgi:hypothetical protein
MQVKSRRPLVKKLIGLGLLLVACRGTMTPNPTPSTPGALGAVSARDAVAAYVSAVAAQDLQAMSAVWGTADGSIRDQLDSDEIMKREIVIVSMLKCIRKDVQVVSDGAAGTGERSMIVRLTYVPPSKGDTTRVGTGQALTRETNFDVVQARSGRWFVKQFDLNKVNDVCLNRS